MYAASMWITVWVIGDGWAYEHSSGVNAARLLSNHTAQLNGFGFAVEKLRFHCGSRTAVFPAMSAILKDEEFVAVEAAVKVGIAPVFFRKK